MIGANDAFPSTVSAASARSVGAACSDLEDDEDADDGRTPNAPAISTRGLRLPLTLPPPVELVASEEELDELLSELSTLPAFIAGTIWKALLTAGTWYHVIPDSCIEYDADIPDCCTAAFGESLCKMYELLSAACPVAMKKIIAQAKAVERAMRLVLEWKRVTKLIFIFIKF